MTKVRRFKKPPYDYLDHMREKQLGATAARISAENLGRFIRRYELLKAYGFSPVDPASKTNLAALNVKNRFALVAALFRKLITWGDDKVKVAKSDRPSVVLGVAYSAEALRVVAAQGFDEASGISREREGMEKALDKVGGFKSGGCTMVIVSNGKVSTSQGFGEKIMGYDYGENFRSLPDGSYLMVTSSDNFSKFRFGQRVAGYILAYHKEPRYFTEFLSPRGMRLMERMTEAVARAAVAELESSE